MNKALAITLVTALSAATAACAAGSHNPAGSTSKLADVAPYPAAQEGQNTSCDLACRKKS